MASLLQRLLPHHHLLRAAGVRTLFVSKTGKALSAPNFCAYWRQLLAKGHQAAAFPPRLLRHIFVDERCARLRPASPASASICCGMCA